MVLWLCLSLTVGAIEAAATPADPEAVSTDGAESTDGADPESASSVEELQLGAEVYARTCSSCHQPGGLGIAGQFPPLAGNPNVADTAYVVDTIENGRQGPLVVMGESYDGVMPSFGTLADEDVAALVAYLQNDLVVPGAPAGEVASGPVIATRIPNISLLSSGLAFLSVVGVFGLLLSPLIVTSRERLAFPVVDAWLRSGLIVVVAVAGLIVVPHMVLTSGVVAGLGRFWQDLVGASLFGAVLVAFLGALWWTHGQEKI